MRNRREILLWAAAGVVGAVVLAWAWPRAFPLLPAPWTTTAGEAEAIALERLRDLGEPVARPYLVTTLSVDDHLERRLKLESAAGRAVAGDALDDLDDLVTQQVFWTVRLYPRAAGSREWQYQATVSIAGDVLSLRRRVPEGEGDGRVDDAEAVGRAREYLLRMGVDVAGLAPEPQVRRDDVGERTDTVVRFRRGAERAGGVLEHGTSVLFAGDELVGYAPWYDDPEPDELRGVLRQAQTVFMARGSLFALQLLIIAVPFLRRYHDGQLGVRRASRLFLACLLAGLVFLGLEARALTENVGIGLASRQQVTWLIGAFIFSFQIVGLAVLGFMSWSVGESFCRGAGWAQKLASLDALFRGRWTNATVARASLRGVAGGLVAAGAALALAVPLQRWGAWPQAQFVFEGHAGSATPVLAFWSAIVAFHFPVLLFGVFLVPSWAVGRFGRGPGLVVALLLGVVFLTPGLVVLPLGQGIAIWALSTTVPVLLFVFGDALSALLAAVTQVTVVAALPLLGAADPRLELHGWLYLLVVASPLLVSLRWLGSDEDFVYRYDDVPPHVRRIAERERQRVELETAARIQSSILPEVPPQLNGVEVAHSYLPATEVGGDFYDVLALDDGRVAVAVGDVAGHGVSSGLVMSMAKSALSVQVSFDPDVAAVMRTVNRLVYQGARQRLLTTLCYAILDPERRELHYASAGHLFPYCVTPAGDVRALEAGSYPLGVRSDIDVRVRAARLAAGESVFLYSDGLVEATPDGGDEPFGFDRLAAALRRHAAKPPAELRDAVLAEVETYRGTHPRDDDLTLLVLRLPA